MNRQFSANRFACDIFVPRLWYGSERYRDFTIDSANGNAKIRNPTTPQTRWIGDPFPIITPHRTSSGDMADTFLRLARDESCAGRRARAGTRESQGEVRCFDRG
jgi:hypothetical protein